MIRRSNILVTLALTGVLLAGSLWQARRSPPPPPPDGPGAGPDLFEREQRRAALLEEDQRVLVWSTAAKRWVTNEVIRRRLGLREGAAALRAIDAHRPPRHRPMFSVFNPGRAEEECYCRSMIEWVRGEVRVSGGDPARTAELEAEFAESRGGPGPLRLPDVSLDRCLPPELLPAPTAAPD